MTTRKTLTLVAALVMSGAALGAQQPAAKPQGAAKETHAVAAAQVKQASAQAKVAVSRDSARALVLARVPKATIESEKLHRRSGRMQYDVKYREAGSKASHWLRIDATTGAITQVPMTASSGQKAHKGS